MSGYSEYTQSALNILRDPTQTMHWYIIPLLLIVMYIVTKELSEKHYHVVLAGFALWGVDIFNEIWNSMICFISGYAPVWGTPVGVGNTAWLLMIGYNIEISFMFLIMGVYPKIFPLFERNILLVCTPLSSLWESQSSLKPL